MEQVLSVTDSRIVSGAVVGLYVRQLALHANLASLVHRVRDCSITSFISPLHYRKFPTTGWSG